MNLSRRRSLARFAAAAIPLASPGALSAALPPVRLVVLDMGGTLIEDRGDVPAALESAMKHHGVASTREEIAQRRGAAKREVIRYFVQKQFPRSGETLVSKIHDEFTANLIEVYRSVPPISGAAEALQSMRSSGYLLATTTGFDRAINSSILTRLGWNSLLAAEVCSDDVTQGRPAPYMIFHAMEKAGVLNVSAVVVVGDTPLDLQSGNNAQVRAVIGVLTGAGTAETLRKEPRAQIIESVAQLPALLPRL